MHIEVTKGDFLHYNSKRYRCALGRDGITQTKSEGDGKTPAGLYKLRRVLYRGDRIERPISNLPVDKILPTDGWCDDPGDLAYNKFVKLPYYGRTETMWRSDECYNILVVIGYNDNPIIPGKGSAIFLHVAKADYSPTAGCIALAQKDLLELLSDVTFSSKIHIQI